MKEFIDRQINLIFMALTMLLSIFIKKIKVEKEENKIKKEKLLY